MECFCGKNLRLSNTVLCANLLWVGKERGRMPGASLRMRDANSSILAKLFSFLELELILV